MGRQEFVLGFQLAGIRNIFEVNKDPLKDIEEIKKKKEIGIVVIDENILKNLDPHDRQDIEDSITPVFVPLSEIAEQEMLRKLIKKSIGVDLWKMK